MNSSRANIQETLQRANTTFFSSQGLQVEWLKNRPEVIPTLAKWLYDEWRSYDASLTQERLIEGFHQRLNDDRIPCAIVALKNGVPIGVVSLKEEFFTFPSKQNDPEFAHFPKGGPWLGSLQIVSEERNKGLGTELLRIVKTIASDLGYSRLFLYTSNADNTTWYCQRGASILNTQLFHNHTITIMQMALTPFKN